MSFAQNCVGASEDNQQRQTMPPFQPDASSGRTISRIAARPPTRACKPAPPIAYRAMNDTETRCQSWAVRVGDLDVLRLSAGQSCIRPIDPRSECDISHSSPDRQSNVNRLRGGLLSDRLVADDLDHYWSTIGPGIGKGRFLGSSLKSIKVPASVKNIEELSFALCENIEAFVFQGESELQLIGAASFLYCSLKSVVIPRSVEILGKFCFCRSGLRTIAFEAASALRRIGEFCFYESSLTKLSIPRNVDFIGNCAVVNRDIESIEACDGNSGFAICEFILVDFRDGTAIRYFGRSGRVIMPKNIEAIGQKCFCKTTIGSLTFAAESQLELLEQQCFESCSVKSITIPASVALICNASFRNARFETLTFERGSVLRQLEPECFAGCCAKMIRFPASLEVFPEWCFRRAGIDLLAFDGRSKPRRIERMCFYQCSLQTIHIPESVELLCRHCFSHAAIMTMKLNSESGLKKMARDCFDYRSVKAIENPLPDWKLARNHVFLRHTADAMIRSRRHRCAMYCIHLLFLGNGEGEVGRHVNSRNEQIGQFLGRVFETAAVEKSGHVKERRIVPTHYAIRTNTRGTGCRHLKSWLVEVSEDGVSWQMVGEVHNSSKLNGKRFFGVFPVVRIGAGRFIRLANIGRNHYGDDCLSISAWEIFGTLLE
jgi:hypothetical protein